MKKNAPETDPRLAEFPAALRKLLDAELAAGNSIVEVASCHPAPPAGAYVKLAKFVSTRPRTKTAEIDFYERNSSIYSGEWTDAKRFYWIIEPPHPPPPEPDMNAIRDAANRSSSGLAETLRAHQSKREEAIKQIVAASGPKSVVQRFEAGMIIDYEKWHDGVGYDLDVLKEATPKDREAIEGILLRRGVQDWRDAEALAVLGTKKTKDVLLKALKRGNVEIRGAVRRFAPELVSKPKRLAHLLEALQTADIYHGLSQTLDEVAEYHPPKIVDALLRGVLERKSDVAVHYAAMLFFIHGKAKSPFDWDHRPFFLKFHTTTQAEREERFRELCAKIGVKPEKYLRKRTTKVETRSTRGRGAKRSL
jgi:hypothetical protein